MTWDKLDEKIDAFRILCSCKKGGAEYEIGPKQTEYSISNLKPNTSYNITIFSIINNSYSEPSKLKFKTMVETAEKPKRYGNAQINSPITKRIPRVEQNYNKCDIQPLRETDEGSSLQALCIIKRKYSDLDPGI